MYFALCRCEIFIPESRSLKAKRSVINRAKERLRARFRVAAGEVALQDLWQRGVLGIALVGARPGPLADGLAAMRRMLEEDPRLQVIAWETRIEPFEQARHRADGTEAGWSDGPGESPRPAGCETGAAEDWDLPAEGDELFGPGWERGRRSEEGS
ncbi:MAG: DUF503 family protein [Candidatus Eisenbacteria bacterium]|nr:DUF503 family protein [Candidatus Eisenbacteria bacterium]